MLGSQKGPPRSCAATSAEAPRPASPWRCAAGSRARAAASPRMGVPTATARMARACSRALPWAWPWLAAEMSGVLCISVCPRAQQSILESGKQPQLPVCMLLEDPLPPTCHHPYTQPFSGWGGWQENATPTSFQVQTYWLSIQIRSFYEQFCKGLEKKETGLDKAIFFVSNLHGNSRAESKDR